MMKVVLTEEFPSEAVTVRTPLLPVLDTFKGQIPETVVIGVTDQTSKTSRCVLFNLPSKPPQT